MANETVRKAMEAEGFSHTQTGGGCTAYIRRDAVASTWITCAEDSASAPTLMSEAVTVAYCVGQFDETVVGLCEFPNVRAALRAILGPNPVLEN